MTPSIKISYFPWFDYTIICRLIAYHMDDHVILLQGIFLHWKVDTMGLVSAEKLFMLTEEALVGGSAWPRSSMKCMRRRLRRSFSWRKTVAMLIVHWSTLSYLKITSRANCWAFLTRFLPGTSKPILPSMANSIVLLFCSRIQAHSESRGWVHVLTSNVWSLSLVPFEKGLQFPYPPFLRYRLEQHLRFLQHFQHCVCLWDIASIPWQPGAVLSHKVIVLPSPTTSFHHNIAVPGPSCSLLAWSAFPFWVYFSWLAWTRRCQICHHDCCWEGSQMHQHLKFIWMCPGGMSTWKVSQT